MDVRIRRRLTTIVSLAMCLAFVGRGVPGAADSRDNGDVLPACIPVSGDAWLSGAIHPSERWVVRAYYTDRDMLDAVAAWAEPWEVHPDEGYLVVDVDAGQYGWLLQRGFRIIVDETRTARLREIPVQATGQAGGIAGFPCYRTVEETFATAERLAAEHPDLATWIDIGDSWEKATPDGAPGYDLQVLRLTNSGVSGPKPALMVIAAVHARELAAAELATRFAETMVANYGADADITWLLDFQEVHILLQANPDGRKRAEAGLLWRKNTNNAYCANTEWLGADLNRNFDFGWGCCGGSSGFQCSEVYRGSGPASEPETRAIQDYIGGLFVDQRDEDLLSAAPVTATGVLLDLHSHGGLVLWPWGFTSAPAPNEAVLRALGEKLAYPSGYVPWQASDLYFTDGTLGDYAYGALGVASFTMELGTDFFQDCATFEQTIVPGNLPALLYAAQVARMPYAMPAGPDAVDVHLAPGVVGAGVRARVGATVDSTRFVRLDGPKTSSPIGAAEYYVNVPPWDETAASTAYAMAAADGAFDEPIEAVEAMIDTAALAPGRHTVFVRGQDDDGHWGAVSAGFLMVVPVVLYLPVSQMGSE